MPLSIHFRLIIVVQFENASGLCFSHSYQKVYKKALDYCIMDEQGLKVLVKDIVKQACELKNKHTSEVNALVNYAAIFSQSKEEFEELLILVKKIGKVVKETTTGPLFNIEKLDTVSGKLQLLKIRMPDKTRLEKGDADFTVSDYTSFKESNLSRVGFKLIKRENFEMIELIDPEFEVRVYFSNPPMDKQLGLI